MRRFILSVLLFILVFAAGVFLLNTNFVVPRSNAKPLIIARLAPHQGTKVRLDDDRGAATPRASATPRCSPGSTGRSEPTASS